VLTFRPEFTPSWKPHSHISQLVLNRLGRKQVETMIEKMTTGKALSAGVMEQIHVKTDGVPLFVEELTKSVVETGGVPSQAPLPTLAIPATLQEALLARLDRLSTARQVAQLGATLGRDFSYELLQAVTPLGETDLQAALGKLVDAEILYRRGIGLQTRYFFKHALIQDAAYQSLLKSTRQQYHQRIAQTLEEQFPDTKEGQPELLAHHYTQAGLIKQALPYWQQAGKRAVERSANVEAIDHLTKGLELLKLLPDSPERAEQELMLQIALGPVLIVTKGYSAAVVGEAYRRAKELCQQIGETPQLFTALWGLSAFYVTCAEFQRAREIGAQFLDVAQKQPEPVISLEAYRQMGFTLVWAGEPVQARSYLEEGIGLYHPRYHKALVSRYGEDPGVCFLSFVSQSLWVLGYPDRAVKRMQEALSLAQELSHPYSLTLARLWTAFLHQFRRETGAGQEQAQEAILLSVEQGFALFEALGTILQGGAFVGQGHVEEGIKQMRHGLTSFRALGAGIMQPYYLALLAKHMGKRGKQRTGSPRSPRR
jgi:tetratricopeptide (TPR) repeat protein